MQNISNVDLQNPVNIKIRSYLSQLEFETICLVFESIWAKYQFLHNSDNMTRLFTSRNEVVAKVMFLLVCVIRFTGRGSASVHAGIPPHPPGRRHPPGRKHPPRRKHPPGKEAPPEGSSPPRKEAPPGIRSMRGRYASYWNAFLFHILLQRQNEQIWIVLCVNSLQLNLDLSLFSPYLFR